MASPYAGLLHREPLSADECRERFRSAQWARLLLTVRCLPAARPAPLALIGDVVVVATDELAVWDAAIRQEVLTVNIDGVEESGATWTVTATGTSRLLDPDNDDLGVGTNEMLAQLHRHGAHLIAVPLTLVGGDLTIWSFPHPRG